MSVMDLNQQQNDPVRDFANRAGDLMANNPWMDHPTVVTVASQTNSPQQAQTAAQQIGQALSQTWNGYEQTWADPVLQAQPSFETGLVQYIHDTIGAPPIDAGTITQLQSALQKDGLGQNLAADGTWSPDWQQQYNQAQEALKASQLAGNKPGSVQTSSALHGALGHLTVTGALDFIWGWAKSLPGDARTAAGEVAGGLAGLGHVISHPSEFAGNSKAEQQTIGAANADVQRILGGKTSKEQQVKAESWGGQLSALNAALSVMAVSGLAKKAVEDVALNAARRTLEKTAPELLRGPGVISKTLFNANQDGRLLGAKWVGNLPGIARVTPLVGQFTGKNGAYYAARTFLAQPYRYAAVRATGQAFSRAQVLGLGLYGDALATSKLPNNPMARSVLDTHTLDAIDHNIAQYGPRIFGQSVTDLNNLALFLHGPIGAGTKGSASNEVGAHVQNYLDNFSDILGTKGVPAAFQQATGLSRNDLLQAAGGDSKFLAAFMTSKVNSYAQDWYADRQLAAQLNGSDANQVDQLAAFKKQYRAMPAEQKSQVVQDMLASDPSMTYLTTRIKGDMLRTSSNGAKATEDALATFKNAYERMQQGHTNGYLQYVQSPQGEALLDEERAFHNAANLPADFGSARHMQTLNPNLTQDIGLARRDTLTQQDVLGPGGKLEQFQQQLTAAGEDPAARQQAADVMADYLYENHNWDARRLGVYGAMNNPERLLEAITSEAKDLAADVHTTYDITPQAQAWLDQLKADGYKLVVGDHLGDFYQGNLPDVGANDGWLTLRRKWAGRAGVDPTRVPDQEAGRATRQGVLDELAHTINKDSRVTMNAYQTAQTVHAMLAQDEGVQKSLPWYMRAVFAGTSRIGLNKTEIQHIADTTGVTESEARGQLEAAMTRGLGPRDVSRKAMYQALTTTHEVKTGNGGSWTWEKVDPQTANLLMRAVTRGYRQPGYIMGWQAIENWARAGYGIGDALATRYAGPGKVGSLMQNVANWPNRIVQVRNRLRFSASATFDMRRWTKQSIKMGLEGVQPVGNPLQHLLDEGSAVTAQKLFAKISGLSNYADQMDANRMLAGRSIFGLYSPLWHGAYFLNELRKAGKTPEEMKDAYNRVFKYGTDGGTSPLERTANTIFFPFSFEKTLLRNTGAYLLDRPAQALVLDLAVDEWRKWDKNGVFGKFVEDHFPLLWELNSLNNAFTHGISPGQLGGINAPIIGGIAGAVRNADKALNAPTDGQKSAVLLNLFLPQNWGAGFTMKNLQRYLPVWGQFKKVYDAANQQLQIGTNALYDVAAQATHQTVRRPTLTTVAQQQYGTREKVRMIDQMRLALDFNARQSDDASKILWQAGDYVPSTLVGQPITRTTIGQYVQQMYPAYDPNKGTAYAQQQAQAEANFLAQVTQRDPAKGALMQQFAKGARSAIGKINRDEYDPAQLAQVQTAFRDIAQQGSRTDPDWMHLWNSFYAYALGPIVSPTGKKAA